MSAIVAAFMAGLFTIFSPCVLPLAPIVVTGARANDARGPVALAAGLAITFGIVGGSLASFGIELGDTGVVRTIAALLISAAGIIMLVPSLSSRSEQLLGPLASVSEKLSLYFPKAELLGQFCTGIVLAIAWAPCVGPTLGAAIALAASGGSLSSAIATMTVFALGTAASLLGAGYCLSRTADASRAIASRGAAIGKKALAVTMVVVGISILSGLDKSIEATFVEAMPDWLVTAATRL
jgi:cytochrome c biogenesis protein CcdA